jgi:squalene synthase HpnC
MAAVTAAPPLADRPAPPDPGLAAGQCLARTPGSPAAAAPEVPVELPSPAGPRPWHAVGHRENFPVGSWLVPAGKRPAVVAIYRFARHADDIADEGTAPAAARAAALDRLDQALERARRGETTGIPVVDAMPAPMARHRMDWRHLHDLLSAFRQDVTVTRYADAAAVQDYCERSANPVGRLVLELFDAASRTNVAAADRICSALQKINFCQDVAIDWAHGRIYLPLATLAAHGIRADDLEHALGAPSYAPAVRAAIADEAARARRQLLAGSPLFDAVPLRLSLELRATVAGGLRILDRMAAVDHDVAARRPHLGWRDSAGLVRRLLFVR